MSHTVTKFEHVEDHANGFCLSRHLYRATLDEQCIIPWAKGFFPQFEIGQPVFVILKKENSPQYEVVERFIEHIDCKIVMWSVLNPNDKQPQMIVSGYHMDQPVSYDFLDDDAILPRDIFTTKQAAEDEIKWTPLDLPYEVFRLALGCNEDGSRNDEEMDTCDLAPCCGNISTVRDILIGAMQNKGIIARYLRMAEAYLNEHEKPQGVVNLKKITDALGMKIDWNNSFSQ